MDPITHGIAGSLIGKSFFSKSRRHESRLHESRRRDECGRVAILAATLGAVFPDIDTVADVVSRDPLAVVKYHRAITHSFFGLPFFAMALAWLTRRATKRLGIEAPSWAWLTAIYGAGIASHILMDGTTSFGTRMWMPFSNQRVAWDLVFIVDLIFTAILLVPQVLAWVYGDKERAARRAMAMWLVFSVAAIGGWGIAWAAGFPFHAWVLAVALLVLAGAFFLPGRFGGWGFRVTREAWCKAGFCLGLAYVGACGVMHHIALRRLMEFAAANRVRVVRIGALPLAPSMLAWGTGIRTPDGMIESRFDLRNPNTPFVFTPDSPPDRYISEALALPSVQVFWNFSRFPVIRSGVVDGVHVVDLGENRFMNQRRGPQPFTYRVTFDAAGQVDEEGMATDGMFFKRMLPEREEKQEEDGR